MPEQYNVTLESVDNFIGIFNTDYNPEALIDFFEECATNGLVINRSSPNVEDTAFGLTALTFRKDIQSQFLKDYSNITYSCFNLYKKQFKILSGYNIQQFTINVQRTLPSEGYHTWHCETQGAGHRVCATMMYLNDDFEGGETEFLHQSLRIKPKKGQMVIFPASYTHVHRGNPPLSGKKYITTSWMEQQ
tara:strand:- start:331 stop:900 length:570 start_codon:yes stop_codon:yes gene_type:complete